MVSVVALTIASLANFALAGIVLLNNRKATLSWAYAALIAVTSLWGITVYIEDTDFGHANIHVLSQIDFILATLMLGLFLWFCEALTGVKSRLIRFMAFVGGAANVVLIVIGQTIQVEFSGQDIIFNPRVGFILFLLYLSAVVLLGLYFLVRHFLRSQGRGRAQLKLVGLGLFLTVLSLVVTNVILPRVFGISSPDIARMGGYSSLFFSGFTMYAIVRHRFMDIRLLVARSAAYALLLATLAAVYILGIFTMSSLFFNDTQNATIKDITSTILALVLAFTFQPLRAFFERITNRVFFRYHYDSQEVLNNFSKILVTELDLDRILKRALAELCENLHIQFAQVIVYNNDRVYRIEHYGPLPRRLMVAPELAKLDLPMLIADEIEGGERKSLMEGHGIRVAMTLRTHEDFIGHLLLGDKLSGDIYSNQDIQLLEIIGKELAVAIQNAKAYNVIQEFNITLQGKVERSTNRLRVANRHLKELDHAKDEFISMASHQLRTPLTTIKGYLSMMQEGDAGPISPGQQQFVTYAFDASQRMVNLISDLLNVSRMSAGRFLIQARPTDMVVMIEDEVRQLQSHAKAKSLKLIFNHPAAALPLVEIDEGKTRQVIMNFIDNAIYYTPSGEVRVILQQTGGHVRLEVRDSGIGVPKDSQGKLFTKFYRAGNAQSVRPDGTGLGLYLAKRVIEDQGGTIIFSSVEGKGSVFGFELPLKPPPSKHKQPAHKESEELAHARTNT